MTTALPIGVLTSGAIPCNVWPPSHALFSPYPPFSPEVTVAKKFHQPSVDEEGNAVPQKYDPSDFIVAPSDSKGISYRLYCRVAPDLERAVEEVLASNRFPFRTIQDVLRWCIREGVRSLDKMEPVTTVSKRVDVVSRILNEEAHHAEFMHTFSRLQEVVQRCLADNSAGEASRIVALVKHQIESMPEGHWRDRYLRELSKQFGDFLTQKKGGVSLKPDHGEES